MHVQAQAVIFREYCFSRKSEKAGETSDGDLICPVLSLEDVVTHFTTSVPNEILSVDKPDIA